MTSLSEHPPVKSATLTIFEQIRDSYPLTRGEHAHMAEKKHGIKQATSTALISQMIRAGLAVEKDGYLEVTMPEYDPTLITKMTTEARARRAKEKEDAKAKSYAQRQIKRMATLAAKKQATQVAQEAPALMPIPEVQRLTILRPEPVENILGRMSIVQARQMYDELKKIFGG